MKQSALQDFHTKLGAQYAEVTGWQVPARYGDPLAEYSAVRQGVGIADLSHRGKARVTGEDRVKWLQSIISNDILPLAAGQGLYSSLLTHKGKMLTYFRVYALTDALMIEDVGEIGETTFQALRKFLLYGTKAKIENCADTHGLLLVSGPKAADLVRTALGVDMRGLKPLGSVLHPIGNHQAMLMRTEETGEGDVEILAPIDALPEVWERLWEVGTPMGLRPFGLEARDMLRLEAGLPLAGKELTEEIVPPEANLEGKAFSLNKGCYPGQEVVARMDTYGNVRRRMVGIFITENVVPSGGTKIFSGDREVGWISSAAYSPSVGHPIALAFPLRDFATPGTELTIHMGGQQYKATVKSLPFYSRQ
jgi:glycine cleavage system T protein